MTNNSLKDIQEQIRSTEVLFGIRSVLPVFAGLHLAKPHICARMYVDQEQGISVCEMSLGGGSRQMLNGTYIGCFYQRYNWHIWTSLHPVHVTQFTTCHTPWGGYAKYVYAKQCIFHINKTPSTWYLKRGVHRIYKQNTNIDIGQIYQT